MVPNWRSLLKHAIYLGLLSLVLLGCGGGGSGSSSGGENPFQPDTTPNAFQFTAQTGLDLGVPVESNTITIEGINTPSVVSISGGEYRINNAEFVSDDGVVNAGDLITLQVTSAVEFSSSVTATINVGGVSASFTVTTRDAPDAIPNEFQITSKQGTALNSWVESDAVQLSGFNMATAISIADGEYAIAGGKFVSGDGLLSPGDSFVVRHMSSSQFLTSTSTVVTVGGVTAEFVSTTAAEDTSPDQFTFVDQTGVELSSVVVSDALVISGFNSPVSIAVVEGEYAIGEGEFTVDEGTLQPGESVRVRHQSAGQYSTVTSTTLTVGGVAGTFTSRTIDPDTTPDSFSFETQLQVAPNSNVTSEGITVLGINQPATISVQGGMYAIGSGPFISTPSTVANGDIVTVQHVSSQEYSAFVTTSLTIGGVSGSFSSQTWPIGTGFNQATGLDGDIFDVAPAIDGSGDVYFAGGFSHFNANKAKGIIRLNADGTMDEEFQVGLGLSTAAYVVIPVSDGSGDIYVGGSFSQYNGIKADSLARLNADGTLDTSFQALTFDASAIVYSLAQAADGSGDLYVGGKFKTYDGNAISGLMRLNSDGSLDSSFNVGEGFDESVTQILSANDGSGDIYVVSGSTTYQGEDIGGVVRINSNGSIDAGFDVGSGFNLPPTSIALAKDGSGDLFVGGNFSSYNGESAKGVVKLRSNGTRVTGYQPEFESTSYGVYKILVPSNGNGDIYLLGAVFGEGSVMHILANGQIDPNFDSEKKFNRLVRTMSFFEGDKILVVGSFSNYSNASAKHTVLLSMSGEWDSRFRYTTGFNDSVNQIFVADDESASIYAFGSFDFYRDTNTGEVAKLTSGGIEYSGFTLSAVFEYGVEDMALIGDGSGGIYVLGHDAEENSDVILKVDPEGEIAQNFKIILNTTFAYQIEVGKDGSGDIYVVFQENSASGFSIRRYNSDGSLDQAFAPASTFPVREYNLLAPASDGVFIGGSFTEYDGSPYAGLVKLTNTGALDTSFIVGTGFNSEVEAVTPLMDGSGDVYVGGRFTLYNEQARRGVVRLNQNGSLDMSFEQDVSSSVSVVTPLEDGSGRLYIGKNKDVFRLFPDGSVDEDFNIGSGFSFSVRDIQIANDGSFDIFVGGIFTAYQDKTVDYIVRLNPDGSLND